MESKKDIDKLDKEPNWLSVWAKNREDATAWLLLFRVLIFNVLTGINFMAFSMLYVEYSIYFDESKAVIGLIKSFEMGAIILGGLFMSWPIERYGYPRMALIGSMVLVVGLISASFAPSTAVLCLTQGVIGGFGYGITFQITPAVVQRHFKQNRGLANGVITLGLSFGNTCGPMIIKRLINNYGWRGTLLLIGGMGMNRAAIGFTFRPPTSKIEVENKTMNSCTKTLRKSLDFSLFKYKPFAIFFVTVFLQCFSIVGFVQFTPLRAVHSGMSLDHAAFLSTVTFIGSISMRVVTMFVSNMKCVDYNMLFAVGVMFGVPSVLFTLLLPGYYGGVIGSVLGGFSIGSANSLHALVALELCGLEHLVRAMALVVLASGSAGLLPTPFCGWLFDISGTYDLAFIITGCAAGTSSLTSLLTYFVHRKIKMKSKEIAESADSQNIASSDGNITL